MTSTTPTAADPGARFAALVGVVRAAADEATSLVASGAWAALPAGETPGRWTITRHLEHPPGHPHHFSIDPPPRRGP